MNLDEFLKAASAGRGANVPPSPRLPYPRLARRPGAGEDRSLMPVFAALGLEERKARLKKAYDTAYAMPSSDSKRELLWALDFIRRDMQ